MTTEIIPTDKDNLLPYHERAFVGAGEYAQVIFAEPERELPSAEKDKVYEFARGLFNGKLDGLTCESDKNLDELDKMVAGAFIQGFYVSYFLSEEGKVDRQSLGIGDDWDKDQVVARLYDLDWILRKDPETKDQVISDKLRKEIAVRSRDYHRADLAARLTESPQKDDEYQSEEILRANYNPDKLLEKIEKYKAFKRFYRQARINLKLEAKSSPTDLIEAKVLMLDIYAQKLNNLLADLYPSTFHLAKQLGTYEPAGSAKIWQDRLEGALPTIYSAMQRERGDENSSDKKKQSLDDYIQSYGRRLDALRRGVARSEAGEFTPIDPSLKGLARELDQANVNESQSIEAVFDAKTLEMLAQSRWDAGQFQIFFKTILARQGLLSEHESDWSEISTRQGHAPDSKWQVVVTPRKKSMSVSSDKRVVFIPASFDRTFTQTKKAGVLFVQPHENEHVWQNEHDIRLSQKIPLAQLHGRGASPLREAGTISQEIKMHQMLGTTRSTNTAYLTALEAKLSGGNRLQVARVYFNENVKTIEPAELGGRGAELREVAVDATARLFANARFNSQPLAYMEQEIIRRELLAALPESKALALMTTGASFSLKDSASLRQFGLIDPPPELDKSPADFTLEVLKEEFLPRLTLPST